MKKTLVVLDLDETLLKSDKTISEYTKTILAKCKQMGHKIVVNTARSYIRAIDFARQISADYICAFNGNLLCDSKENILWSRSIPFDISPMLIEELYRYSDRIVNEGLYASFCTSKKDVNLLDSTYAAINFVKSVPSYKIIVHCTPEQYSSFEAVVSKYNLSISFSRDKNTIRILPFDSDKWVGIERLKQILNDQFSVIAFGDDLTDLCTLKNADIGVRMANSVQKVIEKINFFTDSNDSDGVANFLCHYFNLNDEQVNFDNVKILDCSLRDGGHLNASRFGKNTIMEFVKSLISAKIDIVELGFLQDAIYDENVAVYPTVLQAEEFLKDIDTGDTIISLLAQVDKFDISRLEPCSGKVKMIRISFHSDLIELGMKYCEIVKSKGYICSANPINFSHYTNEQVVQLITLVNRVNPDVFSIVDTFGVLLNRDFRNKINLINHLLNRNIQKGIHLHDNLGLAFSSAQTIIETNSIDGPIIIDTSIAGLGRAPGNLRTEMVAYYMNLMQSSERYRMNHIYALLETEVPILESKLDWSNKFPYSISAFERVHRTYAETLMERGYSLADIARFIEMIPRENKGRYSDAIISQICDMTEGGT